ncbi:MAG: GNAT family N-acetyltransferase [Oscillospiraceae bacterium]|nr:GNAT family N-acetyltransferase [Oscillospiraceae bacterium]
MKDKQAIHIEYLSDNDIFAENIAGWIFNEFIKGIRHGISYEQILLSVKTCHKTTLPVRFAAKSGARCVGTVSVVQNDLLYRDYAPWLASLYVDAPYRKLGIGEMLVDKAKETAAALGYSELYLRTEHAGKYYERLGWQYVESCVDEFKLNTDVYKYTGL